MNKSSQEIATVHTEANTALQKKDLSATKRITYLATLIAASLVLKLVGQVLQTLSFKLTLVYVPWIIAAIAMGPVGGATVAFATDLLGTFVLPTGGAPNPILALSCALFGFIMGLAFKLPKLSPKWKLLIGTIIVIPVCTLGIWSWGMSLYYGKHTFFGWMATRGPQVAVVAVNAALTAFLFPLMKKIGLMKE